MFSLAFVCEKLLSAKKPLVFCLQCTSDSALSAGEEEEEFIFTTSIANEEVQALEPHRVCASPILTQDYGEDDSPISKRSLQTGDAGSVRKTT